MENKEIQKTVFTYKEDGTIVNVTSKNDSFKYRNSLKFIQESHIKIEWMQWADVFQDDGTVRRFDMFYEFIKKICPNIRKGFRYPSSTDLIAVNLLFPRDKKNKKELHIQEWIPYITDTEIERENEKLSEHYKAVFRGFFHFKNYKEAKETNNEEYIKFNELIGHLTFIIESLDFEKEKEEYSVELINGNVVVNFNLNEDFLISKESLKESIKKQRTEIGRLMFAKDYINHKLFD